MQGLNRITIVGNIGNDPELSYTQGGTALLKLRIAVNERRKVQDEWTEVTEWFSALVWAKRAEALAQLLRRGEAVLVEGPMRRREWEDRNGAKRETFEVHADNVILLGGGRGTSQRQETDDGAGADKPAAGAGAGAGRNVDQSQARRRW